MTKFEEKVYNVISLIPKGKVATYSDVAKAIGHPQAARAVGNALHKNPFAPVVPCHRVVNSNGYLAKNFGAGGIKEQQLRLQAEGVIFYNESKVSLTKYQYHFPKESI